MNIAEIIYSLLSESVEVSAIVNDRIFPQVAEDGTQLPLITFTFANDDGPQIKDIDTSFNDYILTVSAWTKTNLEGIELYEAIKDTLHNYEGIHGSITVTDIDLFDSEEAYVEDLQCYTKEIVFKILTQKTL